MENTPLKSSRTEELFGALKYVENSQIGKLRDESFITRQSTVLTIGAVGIFAAYSGVIGLQSTLNSNESLGTTSLALCFLATIVVNVTVGPVLLRCVGAKFLVVMSDIAFIAFSLANIYPAKFTLFPAAIILGIGEAFFWPAVGMFNSQFAVDAVSHSLHSGLVGRDRSYVQNEIEKKTRWFAGRFFSIFSAYLVIGNLMAYAVMKLDTSDVEIMSEEDTLAEDGLGHQMLQCGALDCYEYEIETNKSQSNNHLDLTNYTLRYALFAGYTFLQTCSLVLHIVLLYKPQHVNNDKNGHQEEIGATINVRDAFRSLMRQITKPKQLLLLPLNLYTGMMVSFIFGDMTRSYIACAMGVHNIGLIMAIFGLTGAMASFIFKTTSNYVGNSYFLYVSLTIECFLLLWCFLWRADSGHNNWQIFVFAGLLGVTDCLRQAVIMAIYSEHFREEGSVAFNVLSMLTASGVAIMFTIGTHVCLYFKLIILTCMLFISVGFYTVLVRRY